MLTTSLHCGGWILAIVALSSTPASFVSGNANDDGTTCTSMENGVCGNTYRAHIEACTVYMAPSTLGNVSNMGIYTAKPLEKDTIINFPEIVIPLAFRDWGIHPPSAHGDGELWNRYIWSGDTVGIEPFDTYDHNHVKSVFVPGVGCTINSILDMANLKSTHDSEYDAVVERSHPAAGAFSPYYNSFTKTKTAVPAGAELFADYGKEWIPTIANIPVLLNENLDRANDFLKEFGEWMQRMKAQYGNEQISTPLLERLYKLARKFPHASSAFSVLPPDLSPDQVLEVDTRSYWNQKYQVSVEWLQEHGKCQDHLKPGRSTIEAAGRGAFATRFLPKGSVVGYAPLIHVGYAFDDMTQVRSTDNTTTHPDLVVNYSFGHPQSTLTLTPYGGMVNFINHASGSQANVKVQWPDKELVPHKPRMLEKDVEYLRNSPSRIVLSFDYIALRDIQEGEEVFMDYGDEWQAAWDQHVANWQRPPDAETYVHSTKYKIDLLKTPSERKDDPYPPNLETVCAESYRVQGTKYVHVPVLRNWKVYVPCEVVDRTTAGKYVVKLLGDSTITIYNVPYDGKALVLVDKAYSQDWHLPQAFRHKIGIPDDIFPEVWKNLKE